MLVDCEGDVRMSEGEVQEATNDSQNLVASERAMSESRVRGGWEVTGVATFWH